MFMRVTFAMGQSLGAAEYIVFQIMQWGCLLEQSDNIYGKSYLCKKGLSLGADIKFQAVLPIA